jgi:hypothetical protein
MLPHFLRKHFSSTTAHGSHCQLPQTDKLRYNRNLLNKSLEKGTGVEAAEVRGEPESSCNAKTVSL